MNLNGVTGDARKRLLEQPGIDKCFCDNSAFGHATTGPHEVPAPFDKHPECLLCGRRSEHTHAPDLTYVPISVPRD